MCVCMTSHQTQPCVCVYVCVSAWQCTVIHDSFASIGPFCRYRVLFCGLIRFFGGYTVPVYRDYFPSFLPVFRSLCLKTLLRILWYHHQWVSESFHHMYLNSKRVRHEGFWVKLTVFLFLRVGFLLKTDGGYFLFAFIGSENPTTVTYYSSWYLRVHRSLLCVFRSHFTISLIQ